MPRHRVALLASAVIALAWSGLMGDCAAAEQNIFTNLQRRTKDALEVEGRLAFQITDAIGTDHEHVRVKKMSRRLRKPI